MKITKKGKLTFYDDVVQGTQEWLELREGKVTCSNALTLMNKGKNACMEANRLASIRITPNGNFYAERGHVIENEMRDKYNEVLAQYGHGIRECGFITNDDYPDAGYSPDGIIVDLKTDEIKGITEFKAYNDIVIRNENTPQEELFLSCKHRQACFDMLKIPPQAIAQCNMEMLIAGVDEVHLFLCNPDAAKTDAMIKKLLESDDPKDKEMLKNACPNEDYDTLTPVTKVWTIKKNKTICDRLIKKLL